MAYETLHSEIAFRGRVFDVRREQVRLPDGGQAELDIVHHPGAVTLLPVDGSGRVWMVRQFRQAARAALLELPAGTFEEGETPEACALREARQEIGMAAGRLQKIGEFFMAPGYSTEYMVVFLATELRADPLQADADEFLSVERFPVERVFELAEAGEIRDGKTLAALFLARPHLEALRA